MAKPAPGRKNCSSARRLTEMVSKTVGYRNSTLYPLKYMAEMLGED
jgi:hypothetical protein